MMRGPRGPAAQTETSRSAGTGAQSRDAGRAMSFEDFKAMMQQPESPPSAPAVPPTDTSLTLRTSEQPTFLQRAGQAVSNAVRAGTEAGKAAATRFGTEPMRPAISPFDAAGGAINTAGRAINELAASAVEGRPSAVTPFDVPHLVTGGWPEGKDVAAFAARVAPGLIANPAISGLVSGATETAAQLAESGRITSPGQIGLATITPPAVTSVPRFWRAGQRTLTRVIPGRFEAAQRGAREAGEQMVQSLRPTEDVAALARSARAAGGDLVKTRNITRTLGEISIPPNPADARLEGVRRTMENLRQGIVAQNTGTMARRGGPRIALGDLEAIRRDIGPLVNRPGARSELAHLYSAIVRDLEETAAAGGTGAQLARQAATAFKQDLGASKVGELIEKATTNRVISGAEVPALNVATFMKLTRDPKTRRQLIDQIGQDGLRVIDRFVRDFRSLPPDVAFNGWGRLVMTLGGGFGGFTAGASVAGFPGALLGAITPELMTNFAVVGRNPRMLNRVMTTVAQGVRASYAAGGEARR